jgi:polyhydroxyalkanoate synthase
VTAPDERQHAGGAPPDLGERAADAILGANPFVGIEPRELAGAVAAWLSRAGRASGLLSATGGELARGLSGILAGRSDIRPAGRDGRFADSAWNENAAYRRLMQSYLLVSSELRALVERTDLDRPTAARALFALSLLTEAAAPTNTLLGNPAALRHAVETRGRSLVRGLRNLAVDVVSNGGMPSQVDPRPFQVGGNLATTPGAVVYRDDVMELIQYAPATETVRERPLVVVPPQINKFYVLDLAPGRSLLEYAVAQGNAAFTISWRQPTATHREWGLDTYVRAARRAAGVACDITGSADCNVFGICAGGIIVALLLGHLAAREDGSVHSATFGVTMLDTSTGSPMRDLASDRAVAAAGRRSRRRGYLDGRDMARVFAWMRPNDLVWNYWVNNYLMGNDPPAFDVLYWNSDTTRLPAALHAEYLDLFRRNPLVGAGEISVLETPVDLRQVRCDCYVMAGATDHIVPWQACYRIPHLVGGKTEFVLSSSGHVQSIVNPPGNPKASYHTNPRRPKNPDAWLARAERHSGSWWEHWAAWLGARSGGRRPAPEALGSDAHPARDRAPGRYALER